MFYFLNFVFWFSFFILFYSYIGYGILLFIIIKLKRKFFKKPQTEYSIYMPEISLVIAAYNEEKYIETKILNSLKLSYPQQKLKIIIVTDGSTDSTPAIVKNYSQVRLFHQPERQGKIAAVHRIMEFIKSPIVIFTDANTLLNETALQNIVRHFAHKDVGAVAGEKQILEKENDTASGAGEGFYWKYESKLKTWDSELLTVVGAAGELFAIRTELYEDIPKDTLIEDFYLTLRIAQKGFRVIYEPKAVAIETASADVKEELKRKVRIAAGGIQSIVRLKSLLNPFKYKILTFQYVSHRVLRWTIAPLCLLFLFISNIILATYSSFFQLILLLQALFYLSALTGFIMAKKEIKIKVFFIPYYFFIMNYAVFAGFFRYLKGSQSVIWEKSKRAEG